MGFAFAGFVSDACENQKPERGDGEGRERADFGASPLQHHADKGMVFQELDVAKLYFCASIFSTPPI